MSRFAERLDDALGRMPGVQRLESALRDEEPAWGDDSGGGALASAGVAAVREDGREKENDSARMPSLPHSRGPADAQGQHAAAAQASPAVPGRVHWQDDSASGPLHQEGNGGAPVRPLNEGASLALPPPPQPQQRMERKVWSPLKQPQQRGGEEMNRDVTAAELFKQPHQSTSATTESQNPLHGGEGARPYERPLLSAARAEERHSRELPDQQSRETPLQDAHTGLALAAPAYSVRPLLPPSAELRLAANTTDGRGVALGDILASEDSAGTSLARLRQSSCWEAAGEFVADVCAGATSLCGCMK